MSKLNILILHRLGNPKLSTHSIIKQLYDLKYHFPLNYYLYHDVDIPLPNYVRDQFFHAVILDVTLLCIRSGERLLFNKIKKDYAFIRDWDSVKIAFPQDEYDCCELLDEWLCFWKVDVIYSVLDSGWNVIYPKFLTKAKIKKGYTGYINDQLINITPKKFDYRSIDIGYRARKLSPHFGKIGEVKWSIGLQFVEYAKKYDFNSDIKIGVDNFLFGENWYEFLNNCKFTLGSNSGSSILDLKGDIQRSVREFLIVNPAASFEEVEASCFPNVDGVHTFTALSPRVLEAGVLKSCQILAEGEYSGLIHPWEHYIPFNPDKIDFKMIYEAMTDETLVRKIVNNCRATFLDNKSLRSSYASKNIIDTILDFLVEKAVNNFSSNISRVIEIYERDTHAKYQRLWFRQLMNRKLVSRLRNYPALYYWVKSVANK